MKPELRRPLIFDIHRYALDDGPGIRSTVFFKGCPLSCIWCHNPEGISPDPELCYYAQRCISCGACTVICPNNSITGNAVPEIKRESCDACGLCAEQCMAAALSIKGQFYSVEELVAMLLRDKRFYDNSGGGVTLSGGEPTFYPYYLSRLVKALKAQSVHVILQTCGTFKWDFFKTRLLPWIDLIYFDIKGIDDHLHRQWTGRSNQGILANFSRLAKTAPDKVICSVPLIEGLTAGRVNLRLLAAYIGSSAALPYRLRAYHPGFHFKAKALGKIPPPYLPLHAMAPGEFNRIAAEFEKIVSSLNKKRQVPG